MGSYPPANKPYWMRYLSYCIATDHDCRDTLRLIRPAALSDSPQPWNITLLFINSRAEYRSPETRALES